MSSSKVVGRSVDYLSVLPSRRVGINVKNLREDRDVTGLVLRYPSVRADNPRVTG